MQKHVIWFAGNVDALIGKIVAFLSQQSQDAVIADPTPFTLFDLIWKQSRFTVRRDPAFGLVIGKSDETDALTGEKQLSMFYEEVVRPLADTTGGVACGMSYAGLIRFSQAALETMQFAKDETRRLKQNFVGTEEILLGLLLEKKGIAAQALTSVGINLYKAHQEVERIVGFGTCEKVLEPPFTPRAGRVLEAAAQEADALKSEKVDTEHLLLAIIRERKGVAARVIFNLGVELSDLRVRVLELLPSETLYVGSVAIKRQWVFRVTRKFVF